MSSKITAAPIVDYADTRRSWNESVNPVFGKSARRGSFAAFASPKHRSYWRRHAVLLSTAGLLAVILVSVLAGVLVSRSAASSPAAGGNGGAGSAHGGPSAADATSGGGVSAPTPSASVSATASAAATTASTVSSSFSGTPTATATASASVLPSATETETESAAPTASPTLTPSPTPLVLPSLVAVAGNGSAVELWAARMLAERLALPLHLIAFNANGSSGNASSYGNGSSTTAPQLLPLQPVIAVGYDAALQAGVDPVHLAGLRVDDYLLSNNPARGLRRGCLAVASGPSPAARGALYGAFALLKSLGWRFFTPSMTVVPPRPYALPQAAGGAAAGGRLIDIADGPRMYLRDVTAGSVQDNRARTRNAAYQLVYPPANLSAALGLNGANANLPVGGFEGAGTEGPPGFIATAYNLLVPATLSASSPTCAGPGFPSEPHLTGTPCPQTVRDHPEWVVCRNASGLAWPCANTSWANTQNSNQPCWGEPSLPAAMADGIRAVMRLKPTLRVVDVSGMDGGATICPADEPYNAFENCTGGGNFHAVNAMAGNLSAEFPSLSLQTLAYHGSRAPPQRLRDSVQVRYVPNSWNVFQSLHHPDNAVILGEARGWAAACKTMTVYDNTDNFGAWQTMTRQNSSSRWSDEQLPLWSLTPAEPLWACLADLRQASACLASTAAHPALTLPSPLSRLSPLPSPLSPRSTLSRSPSAIAAFLLAPWPNYFTMPQHIIEFARLGFTGYYAAGWPLQGPDMMDLKAYVASRVMWDPFNANVTALVDEFTDGVYGVAAAPGVRGYLRAMEASFRDNDITRDYKGYPNVRGATRHTTIWNAVYANASMLECGRLLKASEALAASAAYADNVRQAMLPVQYVVLMRWAQLRGWAASPAVNISWPFSATAAEEFALFNATFTRTKVVSVQHYDEYPTALQTTCDLPCLRLLMLGY